MHYTELIEADHEVLVYEKMFRITAYFAICNSMLLLLH